jgi:hypothetical protein
VLAAVFEKPGWNFLVFRRAFMGIVGGLWEKRL